MDLLNEAEEALSPDNESDLEVPNGAAGHYLLGLVYRYTDREKSAVHHFELALSIDPLFWAAYEELCILGSATEASAVFGESAALTVQKRQQHALTSQNFVNSTEDHNQVSVKSLGDASPRQLKSVHVNSAKNASGSYQGAIVSTAVANQSFNHISSSFSCYNTPSPMASQLSGIAFPPVCRHLQQNVASASSDSSPRSTVNTTLQAPEEKFVDDVKLRKISRLSFSDSYPRRSTRLVGEAGESTNTTIMSSTGNGISHSLNCVGNSSLSNAGLRCGTLRKRSGSLEEGTSSSSVAGSTEQDNGPMSLYRTTLDDSKVHNGALEILSLWRLFGDGFRLSCMYKSQDALEIYKKLPLKHYNTGWVLSQVGRAYFELVDYLEADHAFSLARCQCPCSLDGMDVYSTVLYHLNKGMKLRYLAQELLSIDRLAPQTWCAMGNCYSLQKDHDTALKNFERAVQLNSRFTYAHTLCGHEHVALENFESGIKSFQNALHVDSRHYNARYGLGMVYLRQEKFESALYHFQKALQINPHSSVIMSYLGTALHALRRNEEALMMMEKAILTDKKNPLPMYQKAVVLFSMDKYEEALSVLEELKEYAPRECSIYALIGKIYKRINMYDKAILHFGLALDLKPSATDAATIKAAIEKLHVPDDLEDILQMDSADNDSKIPLDT